MKLPFLSQCVVLAVAPFTAFAHDDHASMDRIAELEAFFSTAAILNGPEIVDCTLSQGTQAKCFSITVRPEPQDYTPGPWCPTNIEDDASKGGIWFADGKVMDVDGDFIATLDELYNDGEWQLYDPETGEIRVTDTKEACEAAARPDVAEEFQNHCVQCLPEYMADGASMTYVIPLEPHLATSDQDTRESGSGLAYNGVRLDGPAPVEAILSAHTIAAFDDCGGHVNTHVGYHYHSVRDCLPGVETAHSHDHDAEDVTEDAVKIGIAMDGHDIYSRFDAAGEVITGLDNCGGHAADGMPYHYHAGEAASNAIVGCFKAETGCASEDSGLICDASDVRRGPPPEGIEAQGGVGAPPAE